ncbi:dockerin type I repeat-containing protein [Ruminococcus albus]|uniref:Dockerin domain-containing protein n=1 Tax=Ruminococcus albus TaxID=1264 RepID=A0A1I1D5T7_RUMAL|nr:dockerin type I repeat-containing protein [Ruminococcus albus]SFB70147.1 hypothetical protein SAMN02910406_00248 [Ruminococcus albus]
MSILKKRIVSFSTAVMLSSTAFSGLPAWVLKAGAVGFYDLKIDNVQVNSANCKDILENGVFRYEPSTQTLTINGDYGEKNTQIIESEIDGLTVNVIGDSNLKGTFNFNADTTITGAGKLSLENYDSPYTIAVHNETSLTIENANVDVSGIYPIIGYGTDTKDIYVNNSFLTVHGTESGVQGFDFVSLFKCVITKPDDVVYGGGGIFNKDMSYAKDIRIIPSYDLWIDSTLVTADNCDDILGNGKFYYDPDHRVLGISGNIEHEPDEELIYSMVPDLTIDLVNDIELQGYVVLYGDTVITGDGSLTIGSNIEICICNENCKLTFDNAKVSAAGNVAIGSLTGTIEFINSDITATGNKIALLFREGGFNLTDSMVTEPTPSLLGTYTIYDSASEPAAFVKIGKAKKSAYKLGDVNGDGFINITDITLTAAHVKGKKLLTSEKLERADVNRSGSVNISDITLIAAHVKGKKLLV